MSIWTIFAIVAGTAVFMEFVAWATHKYVMHGFLWSLHSDHHKKDHYGFLERNDAFFLIFAEPAFILFLAVDPVCDMLRTLVLVIGNTAAVAVVCPRPLKI